MKQISAILLLFVAALSVVLLACGGSSSNGTPDQSGDSPAMEAATDSVEVAGFQFAPQTIRVVQGTTVTWSNADQILHTVTAGDPDAPTGAFDGQMQGANSSFHHQFSEVGSFVYFCARHTFMTGTVLVAPNQAEAPDAMNHTSH